MKKEETIMEFMEKRLGLEKKGKLTIIKTPYGESLISKVYKDIQRLRAVEKCNKLYLGILHKQNRK